MLYQQTDRLAGYEWRRTTVVAGSGQWPDWWFGGRSWPGVVLLVLAIAGASIARREPSTRFFASLAVAAFVVSFGSRLSILGWHPWDTLREASPTVARLRSPWRAAAVAQIALVALAVPAVQHAWSARRRLGRLLLPIAIIAGIVSGPIGSGTLHPTSSITSSAAQTLVELTDGIAVVYLPFAAGPSASTFERTTVVMNELLDSGHPLVNGYSGFFPPDHDRIRNAIGGFPDRRSLDALAARAVRYALVDPAWLKSRRDRLAGYGISVLVDDTAGTLLLLPQSP